MVHRRGDTFIPSDGSVSASGYKFASDQHTASVWSAFSVCAGGRRRLAAGQGGSSHGQGDDGDDNVYNRTEALSVAPWYRTAWGWDKKINGLSAAEQGQVWLRDGYDKTLSMACATPYGWCKHGQLVTCEYNISSANSPSVPVTEP